MIGVKPPQKEAPERRAMAHLYIQHSKRPNPTDCKSPANTSGWVWRNCSAIASDSCQIQASA